MSKAATDANFEELWITRKSDPGETRAGSKAKALAEWRKLDMADQETAYDHLTSDIVDRHRTVRLNGKLSNFDPTRVRIPNLPHLFRWIKERRWE